MAPIVMNASNGIAENGKFSSSQSKWKCQFFTVSVVRDVHAILFEKVYPKVMSGYF